MPNQCLAALSDAWMHQLLEPFALVRIVHDDLSDSGAIGFTVRGDNRVAPPSPQLPEHVVVVKQGMIDAIRVNHAGTQLTEHGRDRALARGNAAGDADDRFARFGWRRIARDHNATCLQDSRPTGPRSYPGATGGCPRASPNGCRSPRFWISYVSGNSRPVVPRSPSSHTDATRSDNRHRQGFHSAVHSWKPESQGDDAWRHRTQSGRPAGATRIPV